MWSLFVENKGILKEIYKDIEPSLMSLCIREFSILTGEDVRVVMKFDTNELPINMPQKWQESGVNTVQFIIEFIGVDLSYININNDNYQKVDMFFKSLENKKHISCLDVLGNKVFDLETNWIYLKNITGYQNTKVTD